MQKRRLKGLRASRCSPKKSTVVVTMFALILNFVMAISSWSGRSQRMSISSEMKALAAKVSELEQQNRELKAELASRPPLPNTPILRKDLVNMINLLPDLNHRPGYQAPSHTKMAIMPPMELTFQNSLEGGLTELDVQYVRFPVREHLTGYMTRFYSVNIGHFQMVDDPYVLAELYKIKREQKARSS